MNMGLEPVSKNALAGASLPPRIRYIILCLVCLTLHCHAQELTLAQMDHASWTVRDGAPAYIQALAQAPDGALWIGSRSGLYRFDGVHFSLFQPGPSEPRFPANEVNFLYFSRDGSLWIGFNPFGLAEVRDGHVILHGLNEGMPPGAVTSILESSDGAMWVIERGGIFKFNSKRWMDMHKSLRLPNDSSTKALIARDGSFWVCGPSTVYHVTAHETRAIKVRVPNQNIWLITDIVEAPDSHIWISIDGRGKHQIGRLSERGNEPTILIPLAGSERIMFDRYGYLWATSSESRGVARVDARNSAALQPEGTFHLEQFTISNGSTDALLEDYEGSVWVGTDGGLVRFKKPRLVELPEHDGHGLYSPAIAAGPDGEIWIGAGGSKLISYSNNKTASYGTKDMFWNMYCDSTGTVWFTSKSGFWSFDGRTFAKQSPPVGPKNEIHQVVGTNGSDLYVSIRRAGLWHLRDGVWEKVALNGLPEETPMSLLRDSRGLLWTGYVTDRVARSDGHSAIVFSDLGLSIVSILKESSYGILAGGAHGLALFSRGRFHLLHTVDPSALDGTSGIIETQSGDLWLNTAHGIFRIPKTEMSAENASMEHRIQTEAVSAQDQLYGPADQWVILPTAVEGQNHRMFFSTAGKVVYADEGDTPDLTHPPVVQIVSAVSDERPLPLQTIRVPANPHALHIGYFGLHLAAPELVHYRYLLNGIDHDWQDAGTRTEAIYTQLGPGRYVFRVAAAIANGSWYEAEPKSITVLPAFYQTKWFYAICLVCVLLTIWAGHVIRLRILAAAIREKAEERANERVTIARDLHDTLLQGVHGLMLRFHFVAQTLPDGSEGRGKVESALTVADAFISEARDRVRQLRSVDVDLARSLQIYGNAMSEQLGIQFVFSTTGVAVELRNDVEQELLLIVREAVANAMKHSGGSEVNVEILYEAGGMRLSCRDNGQGIQRNAPDYREGDGHWGMLGMRERSARIDAKFDCWSEPNRGTRITVSIDARRVYLREHASPRKARAEG
jgi:signal transduction histidine kinase/ligand-binding sensor domain-containing protein